MSFVVVQLNTKDERMGQDRYLHKFVLALYVLPSDFNATKFQLQRQNTSCNQISKLFWQALSITSHK